MPSPRYAAPHGSDRRTAGLHPAGSSQHYRASISFPRQERDEIRHGFKPHIFVDRYVLPLSPEISMRLSNSAGM